MIDLPKTRAEAVEASATKYFTGVPCKSGHVSTRYALNAVCTDCHAVRSARWRAKAPRAVSAPPEPLRPKAPSKPRRRLHKLEVAVTVADIDTVDAFNEARLRARFPDDPGKRIGPMPRLLPKGRIRLFAHPDDVSVVVTYANLLRTAK